jgi:ABC-type multidrug transport system fused ATPase/permease subunit
VAAITTVLIATTVGAIAAYFGGWIDGALMRFADLILLMPLLPVLILLSAMFEINHGDAGVMIGVLSGFGGDAIVLKSQALSIKVKSYIDAAGSPAERLARHLPPHRPQRPAAELPLHDVRRDRRDRHRGHPLVLRPPQRPDDLGDHDQHRPDQRLPAQRHLLLVAALPGGPGGLVPVLRLLPRGAGHGRGDQPRGSAPAEPQRTHDALWRTSNTTIDPTKPLLEVDRLVMHYKIKAGEVSAVEDVGFTVHQGEAVGLVGESGCGKTSIALSLLRLLPSNAEYMSGEIRLNGEDLLWLSPTRRCASAAGRTSRWSSRAR